MLETDINITEWPSLQYCAMSAFGRDALQRKAMSHKSSFVIIDKGKDVYNQINRHYTKVHFMKNPRHSLLEKFYKGA